MWTILMMLNGFFAGANLRLGFNVFTDDCITMDYLNLIVGITGIIVTFLLIPNSGKELQNLMNKWLN